MSINIRDLKSEIDRLQDTSNMLARAIDDIQYIVDEDNHIPDSERVAQTKTTISRLIDKLQQLNSSAGTKYGINT